MKLISNRVLIRFAGSQQQSSAAAGRGRSDLKYNLLNPKREWSYNDRQHILFSSLIDVNDFSFRSCFDSAHAAHKNQLTGKKQKRWSAVSYELRTWFQEIRYSTKSGGTGFRFVYVRNDWIE